MFNYLSPNVFLFFSITCEYVYFHPLFLNAIGSYELARVNKGLTSAVC